MKKRIYIAMDHDGDVVADASEDLLHERIEDETSLHKGYRVVAIDLEMTPPTAWEDDRPAAATVVIPDDAGSVTGVVA